MILKEGLLMIKAYIDASTKGNPGPSGGGIVLVGENIYQQQAFPLPYLTNHQAEFAVFSHLLDLLLEKKLEDKTIIVYTDSKILAQSLEKNYSKNSDFLKFLSVIEEKIIKFPLLMVQWIPEAKNKGADHLARQGLQKALRLEDRRE